MRWNILTLYTGESQNLSLVPSQMERPQVASVQIRTSVPQVWSINVINKIFSQPLYASYKSKSNRNYLNTVFSTLFAPFL